MPKIPQCQGLAPNQDFRALPRGRGSRGGVSAVSLLPVKQTLFLLLALIVFVTGLHGAVEIVLADGQVIKGADVRRDGDLYIIELESGGLFTVPFSLVHQVRLIEDDRPQRSPEGWTYAEPQQLAGNPVEPLRPSDAQEVFGEPSRFQPNVVDPNWRPESGFPDEDVLAGSRSTFRESIIDPSWKPKSAFPDRDVLKGSRSTFQESIVDNTWVPEDGFKRKKTAWKPEQYRAAAATGGAHMRLTTTRSLTDTRTPTLADREWAKVIEKGGWYRRPATAQDSGFRFQFKLQASRPSAKSAVVRGCAEKIFQLPEAEAGKLGDARYAQLPIDLFESSSVTEEAPRRAVFTVAGGECRPISGDLTDSLGVKLTERHTSEQGADAYNAALGDRIKVQLTTDEAKIDYAFAVVSLIDPKVSGHGRASLLLVPDKDALKEIAKQHPVSCSLSSSKRKKAAKPAKKNFEPPHVSRSERGETVELVTWSGAGGTLTRHTVRLSDDGKVSVKREQVAAHVGDHVDGN